MKTALLLIDFQRDFLAPDGRMPVARGQIESVVAATNKAISAARARGEDVVAIGNEFLRSDVVANFFRRNAALAGSPGAAWDERIPITGAPYFRKWRGDAFCNPALEEFLRNHCVGQVALAGVFASGCVSATANGALARGFRVTVLGDAVADANGRARDRALQRLARCGASVAFQR